MFNQQQERPNSFQSKFDQGLELSVEYFPKDGVIRMKGENVHTLKDYFIDITQEKLRKIQPDCVLKIEEFYELLQQNLTETPQKDTISPEFVVNIFWETSIRSKAKKFIYTLVMEEKVQNVEYRLEKNSLKIGQLYQIVKQQQLQINELMKQPSSNPFSVKATVVPTFNRNYGSYHGTCTYPDQDQNRSAIRSNYTGTYNAFFGSQSLKEIGIQIFKVQIVNCATLPTPQLIIGVAYQVDAPTIYAKPGSYCCFLNNGTVYRDGVNFGYCKGIQLQKEDIITVIVDMDKQTIQFGLPEPFINRVLNMPNLKPGNCYPFVELFGQNDQVRFIE